MIPPTVMTVKDWDRDIRPDRDAFDVMIAWVGACGVDADQCSAIELDEGVVTFVCDNLACWRHHPNLPDLREIRIVVPGAPLPPRWHTRIAPMPEPTS